MAGETSEKRYKIGEVCRKADVQPYVLRYWETEFPALSPGKSGGGQRQYTEEEVAIILRIKELLYEEGFTIAGAKKRLEAEIVEGGAPESRGATGNAVREEGVSAGTKKILDETRKDLRKILELLD